MLDYVLFKMYHVNSYLVSVKTLAHVGKSGSRGKVMGLFQLLCPWLYMGGPNPGDLWDLRGRNRAHSD